MIDEKEAALIRGERAWTTVSVGFALAGAALWIWGEEDPFRTIAVVCWAWAVVTITWASEFRGKHRMYQDMLRRRR